MSLEMVVGIIIFAIAVLFFSGLIVKKAPRRGGLNQKYFQDRWMALLERVKTPEGLILSVIDADKLLDEALKKSRFSGKTMGERMVSAQRKLSDNDGVWFAHKLRNRLVHEPNVRLKEADAKRALSGFRQALKDLGAL